MTIQYVEKRSYIRMKIEAPIELIFDPPRPSPVTAECRDLSSSGMLIKTEEQLQVGERVQVKLNTSREQFLPLSATIRITRHSHEGAVNFYGCVIEEFL